MKKFFCVLSFLSLLTLSNRIWAKDYRFTVDHQKISQGQVAEKIWLKNFAMPTVTIGNMEFGDATSLPKDAKPADPQHLYVQLGIEKKRPFAIVHIPVFHEDNGIKALNRFSLSVEETTPPVPTSPVYKTTDVTHSVLASGKWYKIGVTQTGFYKIDYSFLTSMGIDPSKIDPSKIRLFGNGGAMLSENNSIPRSTDLLENAIYVSSAGSTFANGDYIVFYASGTTAWTPDSVNRVFNHRINLYSDTACYFLCFDLEGSGMRVMVQATPGVSVTDINYYDYRDYHEVDLVSPAGFGKDWFGEEFNPLLGNLSQTYHFTPGSALDSVYCSVSFANIQDQVKSNFSVSINSKFSASYVFPSVTAGDAIMNTGTATGKVPCNSSDVGVTVTFTPSSTSADGWLDYIELNGRRQLVVAGDQMSFRDFRSVGNAWAAFHIQGASSSSTVWDVTNGQVPVLMSGSMAGGTYSFIQDATRLHEYALMNSTNLYKPTYLGQVANQDLHGSGHTDCIIVTNPLFLTQATQLATLHQNHDGLRVVVATTDQVYNEFSSGIQDISAIRDFARMFYDRAGSDSTQLPRYLLLFGGASYDYKNRLANNSNFVPVFESANSINDLNSFSTDDFYGFLDSNEYIEGPGINALDIAVGRLPARSKEDAVNAVSNAEAYVSTSSLGPWRISATIVADNDDQAGDHMEDAEAMAAMITGCSRDLYNERKVYLDALPIISTPAGTRCPSANAAIDDQIYKGTFMVNYNGHGNTQVWAGERVLTQDDFNNWQNANMLPFMVTATCDFGQFDHPQYVSAAEALVNRASGGVIALMTTTQAVYALWNRPINQQFLSTQFTRNADFSWNTFGDAEVVAKNSAYETSTIAEELMNYRKFALLGDPALTPAFPKYNTTIDSVLDGVTLVHSDSVKALGSYLIKGSVRDFTGAILSGFNGDLTVTIFDKPRNIETISGTNNIFQMQDNTIYKGKVTVANGQFSFRFITPKDIYYFFGKGKISMYAQNGITDAAGADTSVVIGGFSDNPVLSTNPPLVRPFINDSLFRNGGITGSNTSLFVILNDETGINVSGNAVGHDLLAVLDGNAEQPYILNDFYETAPNTYQTGYVNFPVTGLADGKHNIKVTAWDVNDNTGSGEVDFTVVDGNIVDIRNLANYPNPFNDLTHFVFEHNHPLEQLKVQIEIYNTAGELVKNISQEFTPEGSWSNDITWDGTDNHGGRLASGVYVYRLNITTDRGFVSSAYQKLVIVR